MHDVIIKTFVPNDTIVELVSKVKSKSLTKVCYSLVLPIMKVINNCLNCLWVIPASFSVILILLNITNESIEA